MLRSEKGRVGQPGARGRRGGHGAQGPGSRVPSLEPGRGQGSGAGPRSGIPNQVGVPGLNGARPGRPPLPGFGVGPGPGPGRKLRFGVGPRGRLREARMADEGSYPLLLGLLGK